VLGENFSDARLAASARRLLQGEELHPGIITCQDRVAATAAAKSSLAAGTGALAVDMETGWIAAVCAEAGVPMLSLRAISDAAGQDFPVPPHFLFDAVRQRPRYLALPAWLLAHPGRIAPFVRFVRGLGPARARLARALRRLAAGL
jgi:adenosylhomocysteine nucleosidase